LRAAVSKPLVAWYCQSGLVLRFVTSSVQSVKKSLRHFEIKTEFSWIIYNALADKVHGINKTNWRKKALGRMK
jgi:hypothetical protein